MKLIIHVEMYPDDDNPVMEEVMEAAKRALRTEFDDGEIHTVTVSQEMMEFLSGPEMTEVA